MELSDPSIPYLVHTDILDATKILLLVADIQGSTPGVKGKITVDEIYKAVSRITVSATAHGLAGTDIGKPLAGASIFDNTNPNSFPTWVLTQVIDANTFRAARHGGLVTFDDSLVEAGYDPLADGSYVYWDNTQQVYAPIRPVDSIPGFRENLYVHSVSGGVVKASVIIWPPLGAASAQVVVVDTASDLSTLSLVTNTVVLTKGFATIGDGKANIYRYDSVSSFPIDNLNVLDGPGSVGRYFALTCHAADRIYTGSVAHNVVTASDGDTTPSVIRATVLRTANSVATNLYGLDDIIDGQSIRLILGANDTLKHNDTTDSPDAKFVLNGSVDFTPGVNGSVIDFQIDGVLARQVGN